MVRAALLSAQLTVDRGRARFLGWGFTPHKTFCPESGGFKLLNFDNFSAVNLK